MKAVFLSIFIVVLVCDSGAFSPITSSATTHVHMQHKHKPQVQTSRRYMLLDGNEAIHATTNIISNFNLNSLDNTLLVSFADQGQNLAGIFFQASLIPYVVFLYFLSFRGNRIPDLANYGFQFLLLFVLATIPSGIITKSLYGCSLANVDWLHGGAEALLTITNILIVLGFKHAMTNSRSEDIFFISNWKEKAFSLTAVVLFALLCISGPGLGLEAHSPFLFGIGNLNQDFVSSLPWVRYFFKLKQNR